MQRVRGCLPPHSSRRPDPPRLQEKLLPHCNSNLNHRASCLDSVLTGLGEALPAAWSAGLPATQSRSPLLPFQVTASSGQTPLNRSLASLARPACVCLQFTLASHGASSRARAGAGLRSGWTQTAAGQPPGQTGRCILAMLRWQGWAHRVLVTLGALVHLPVPSGVRPPCKGHVLPTPSTRGCQYPPTVY
jgi:hypothetical protein